MGEDAEKLKAEFRATLKDYVENGSGIEKRRKYNEDGVRVPNRRAVKKAAVWPAKGFFDDTRATTAASTEASEIATLNPEDEMS